jgi:diguanylate cyclase (GGDEF)-like protein
VLQELNEVLTGGNARADRHKVEPAINTPDEQPRGAPPLPMAGSGEHVDLERFLSVLEGVRTVPFSGEFSPDGSFSAPYTGPGIHLLLGGDLPEGIDGGEFWATRVLPVDRARYDEGMALQRHGASCQMEYRIEALDGRVLWIRECSRATAQADGSMRIDGIVIDVTDQRARDDAASELEEVLSATRGRLDSVLSAIDEYLYAWRFPVHGPSVIDFESMPLEVFLGCSPTVGDPEDAWLEAVHPDDRAMVAEDVLAAQHVGLPGSVEYRIRDGSGETRWLLDRWRCRREPGGIVAEGIVSDITTRKQAQDGMAAALASAQVAYGELEVARALAERASNTDPLTGLANRRSFQNTLDEAVAAAASDPFGLLLLDVDHFKRTNDTHGHQAGDDVLIAVVACLRTALPEPAIVGRWGGEEFTVLVPGVRTLDALRAIADGIRLTVRDERLETRRGALAITISCGGVLSGGGRDTEELVHAADAAMYRAKESGRDRTLLAGDDGPEAPTDEPELLMIAQSFAHTASIREGVPELHCAQVAELAGRIALRLDLPAATVLRCRLSGWLHDVGKIAIPDRVLAKPGPLTTAEWRVMITHAAFGADLVARTPGIAESAEAVRHHHERWDGEGYPDRLRGHDIPIEARVVAAADTWNAMTTDRVYKRALEFDAACVELLAVAGSQLDPSVAEALLAIVREERSALLPARELAA